MHDPLFESVSGPPLLARLMSNPFNLAEERILSAQLGLLMKNSANTIIPASLMSMLMLWLFSSPGNAPHIWLWCVVVLLSLLRPFSWTQNYQNTKTSYARTRNVTLKIMIQFTIKGGLLGVLAWVQLDHATLPDSTFVLIVVAGMAAFASSILSPVFPVFAAFIIPELGAVALKMWLLNDPTYTALSLACILYIIVLLVQTHNSAKETRKGIELRFENAELVEKLHLEISRAEHARNLAKLAQEVAEDASLAKSKFFAAAGHDLRQPLHAQGLFLEVLQRTELTAHQQELIASANAASQSSIDMLNTLLDFSRIEAGVVQPYFQTFLLQTLFNKIEREFAPQADAKGLIYRSRETEVVAHSDPILVELILRNLVSNAIRYTESGGLLIACRKQKNGAVLEVWDTGIGIAPDDQLEVFREFHQLGNPERDQRKGLGLGLSIAEGLARTLGCSLSVASTIHRGSVFRLSLNTTDEMPTLEEPVLAYSRMHSLHARVLVIDDNPTVREGTLQLLRDWGCDCVVTEFIEEAIELARIQAPDIIISDYRLRNQRTGLEAIAALREFLGDSLPALLISGDIAPERLQEAHNHGIPMLHKPVSPSMLHQTLVMLLQSA